MTGYGTFSKISLAVQTGGMGVGEGAEVDPSNKMQNPTREDVSLVKSHKAGSSKKQ